MGFLAVFVHLVILFVVEQREGEVVVAGHLAAEEQGRVADAPE